MKGYREIALLDLEEALFNLSNNRYRPAVFFFQQFAEKSAKALLEKIDPFHKLLKSHVIELILEAYDDAHKISDLGDKARYLTSFYFNARYPGDNYSEITEGQANRAKLFAGELEDYFKAELQAYEQAKNNTKLNVESLQKIDTQAQQKA